ncbi:MAG: hypothetical protein ACI8S6_003281 [Myxococcota bacterium]
MLLAILLVTTTVGHAIAGVPPDLEARILARALAYDRALSQHANSEVLIGVVEHPGSPTSRQQAAAIRDAFEALSNHTIQGLPLRVVILTWIDAAVFTEALAAQDIDTLYLTAGLDGVAKTISASAKQQGCSTITGVEGYVRDGSAAIGVVVDGNRPSLLVNLPEARALKMDLDSTMLQLAEVIR